MRHASSIASCIQTHALCPAYIESPLYKLDIEFMCAYVFCCTSVRHLSWIYLTLVEGLVFKVLFSYVVEQRSMSTGNTIDSVEFIDVRRLLRVGRMQQRLQGWSSSANGSSTASQSINMNDAAAVSLPSWIGVALLTSSHSRLHDVGVLPVLQGCGSSAAERTSRSGRATSSLTASPYWLEQ